MTMTKENGFQSELIEEMNKQGAYAFKASNMYTTGVPDIAVDYGKLLPDLGPFLHAKIECKLIKPSKAKTRRITTELSVPQEAHLNKTTAAGGIGCWAVGYTFQDCQRWGLFLLHATLGRRHTFLAEDFDNFAAPWHFIKERGKPWPIKNILAIITRAEVLGQRELYANWAD